MAKNKNVVSTKNIQRANQVFDNSEQKANEALEQLNDEINKEEFEQLQNEEIVASGNKVRKASSFGSILKGIQEVRKQRLAKFKQDGEE